MEKKVNIRLPKGKEAKNVQFNVVDGKIEVSYDLEEVFNPKDGDFLTTKDGRVFIYNGLNTDVQYGAYCGIDIYNTIKFSYLSPAWTCKDGCRYATEDEKKEFLDFVKQKFNQVWNADKLCFEETYVPKFGDIVKVEFYGMLRCFKKNYMICIYPDKENMQADDFFEPPFLNLDGEYCNDKGSNIQAIINPASEAEKKELFDKLAEVGKRWNSETKQIEDIRWRAKIGGSYYHVTTTCHVFEQPECGSCVNDVEYDVGNYFRTPEAAQKVANQIKEIFKNSKAE